MNLCKIICLEIIVEILTSSYKNNQHWYTVPQGCSFSCNIELGCRSTPHKILHRLEFCRDLGGSEFRFLDNA